jgi:large subunit ribosomal protein L25
MEYKITATERKEKGTKECRTLREQGLIPAVVYGEGKDAVMIKLDAKEFVKVWRAAGESTVVTITGVGADKSVLIQDVAQDPLYDTPLHVDFYAVRTDKAVSVDVPIVFEGVAPAEKELGGNVMKVMHNLTIEALPKDLPQELTVDISVLKTFSDQIQVKDVVLPSGVTTELDPEEVVAIAQAAKEEEVYEVEEAEEVDVSAVEVEKKGKEDEGGEQEGGEKKEE